MLNSNFKNDGFTLAEIMIVLALSTVVLGGAASFYVSIMVSSKETLVQTKLGQQVNGAMSLMVGDIRRAGYWGNLSEDSYSTPDQNPFNQIDNTALEVLSTNNEVAGNSESGGDCILYTYDADNNGVLDDNDISGFRLVDGVIQMRLNGNVAENTRHDDCNDGNDNWQNLTDGGLITISSLVFTLGRSSCINAREPDNLDNDGLNGIDDGDEADCFSQTPTTGSNDSTVIIREVTISVTGALNAGSLVAMSLIQDVTVRNDLVRVW